MFAQPSDKKLLVDSISNALNDHKVEVNLQLRKRENSLKYRKSVLLSHEEGSYVDMY